MKHACAAVLLLALGLAGLSSAAPVAGSPAVSVPSHLVGYWPMDEASGAVLDDCSGGGREGRVLGTPEWVTADRGAAIRLAGKDSGLRIPSNPAWDAGDGELTVALWVKAEPGGGQGFLLDHYFGGVPGVWGLVVQGGAPLFCLYDDAAKPRRLSFPGFDTARWQHLAVVWRRATDGWVRCYLNGKLVDSLDGVACRTKHQDDLYVGVRQGADQRFACSVRDLAIFDRALPAADVAALHETGIVLAAPVVLTALRTDKLLYAPRETGEATLRLKNLSAAPQAVELTLQLVSSLRRERELKRLSLTLAPKSTQTLSASFSSAGEDYGCELRANVSQGGKRLAEQREVFSVAENFATVGIGSDWGGGLHTGLGQHREIPARARQLYSNYFEIFFWSPCDWALHVAPAKQWWSGQASYLEDEDNLKELIARSHEQGIKVAFYASCNPAGPFGWEVARRHPEWFGGGSFDGRYEVEPLEKWNDPAWRKGAKGNPGWFLVSVDLRHLAALDYGIDRIRDSIKAYGWDAVRFDGHYTILGNDPLSTRNMRRLKERVWQDTPGFGFGFNYGRAPEWLGGITHEIREAMAGGGLYLQEGIRNWRYTNDSYTSWRHYGTNELRIAKQLQALGGTYHCMWSDSRLTPDQAYYKLVYGLIAGGHPAGSEIYANTPGCPNWGAFMTRWSSMLWHLALRPAEAEQARFTVDAADVQWREWLQERVESPTRKYIIQHLVNPPRSDTISDLAPPKAPVAKAPAAPEPAPAAKPGGDLALDDAVAAPPKPAPAMAPPPPPPPSRRATITYRPAAGTRVAAVFAVRPDAAPFELELTPAATPAGLAVTVPVPSNWTLVIWELEGTDFVPPPVPPRFTEAPDPAKLQWSANQALTFRPDPNQPDLVQPVDPGTTVIPLNTGGVNIGRVTTPDPASPQGTVQWRDAQKASGKLGKWWTGPYPPGRYRAAIRLKWVDDQEPPVAQSYELRVLAQKGAALIPQPAVFVTPGFPNPPQGAVTLGERGTYQDYEIGVIDIKTPEYFTFDGNARTAKVGANALYAEAIVVRQLERYTDAQLAAGVKPAKPEGLRTPNGAAPQKVLVVHGLFTPMYGLDKLADRTAVYALPATYEELYACDTVVLCNVDVRTSSFDSRRRLHDFVTDGGRLVMLGGNRTFGGGGMAGTYLEDLSPVAIRSANDVIRCEPPLALGSQPGVPYPGQPLLFWRHELPLKPDATVLAWAGAQPVAAWHAGGKGRVYLFMGTVLGEPVTGQTPFWQTASWQGLVETMVRGL